VDEILEDAQRESRSGVLSLASPGGESRMLIRAGEVVERPPADATRMATEAEFQELDPRREDIVAHDPSRLPGRGELPPFEAVPELLRTVLVVDDNAFFRRFLRDLLVGQGFSVHEASDGEEGLRQALEHRPWLVLTDVRMPGVDGVEFCRRVRGHSLIRHTPIVFLSGWDDYKERYRSLEAGGDEFLSKDTPVRELMIRIHLILKRFANLGGAGRPQAESAMKGRLDLVGAPGVLQVCHLGQITGILTVVSAKRHIRIGFRDGEILFADGDQTQGVEAIYEFLGWTRGQFEFSETNPGPERRLGESFDQVLLEGCRRLDEMGR
jgi:CheY-like chemotaxis protein